LVFMVFSGVGVRDLAIRKYTAKMSGRRLQPLYATLLQ
jgi:hypothetical protein